MRGLPRLPGSSVGMKVLVAATGILLFLFLCGHLAGNLLIYGGPEALNAYALWLKEHPALVWAARIGLLLLFSLHVANAVLLWMGNKRARPSGYIIEDVLTATYASRSMVMTGLLILAYLVFHLLHFTFGAVLPEAHAMTTPDGRHDVFRMVVTGFQNPIVTLSYAVAMVLLGLHLSHGLSSLFQTLGLAPGGIRPYLEKGGTAVAILMALAYLSIPVSVLLGWVTLPKGGN